VIMDVHVITETRMRIPGCEGAVIMVVHVIAETCVRSGFRGARLPIAEAHFTGTEAGARQGSWPASALARCDCYGRAAWLRAFRAWRCR